jgi:hypothetical protein
MTRPTLDEAIARIAVLEAGFEKIQELLLGITARLPPPPKPFEPPKPPAWAAQSDATGVAYSGEPTPPELAGAGNGGLGGVITHPDGSRTIPGQGYGVRYDREGNAIRPGPPEPRPQGPDHDRRHLLDVALMDQAFETDEGDH